MRILTYRTDKDAEIAVVRLGRKRRGVLVSVEIVGRDKVEVTVQKTLRGCPGTSGRYEFRKTYKA